MSSLTQDAFGYRYIPGPFQYSSGISALPGFHVERIRFAKLAPLAEGFDRVKHYLEARSLPLTAFAACELRSPAPFDDAGFRDFNRLYVGTLERWGIMEADRNPVARSNTCPEIDPPSVPSLHAFSVVVPGKTTSPSFVISGGAEARDGQEPYRSRTIRLKDRSPEGMREKANFVLTAMERRMATFEVTWAETTGVQVYSVYDIHPVFADGITSRGAARHGLTWHFNRPPVQDLDYEMDCRGVTQEHVID